MNRAPSSYNAIECATALTLGMTHAPRSGFMIFAAATTRNARLYIHFRPWARNFFLINLASLILLHTQSALARETPNGYDSIQTKQDSIEEVVQTKNADYGPTYVSKPGQSPTAANPQRTLALESLTGNEGATDSGLVFDSQLARLKPHTDETYPAPKFETSTAMGLNRAFSLGDSFTNGIGATIGSTDFSPFSKSTSKAGGIHIGRFRLSPTFGIGCVFQDLSGTNQGEISGQGVLLGGVKIDYESPHSSRKLAADYGAALEYPSNSNSRIGIDQNLLFGGSLQFGIFEIGLGYRYTAVSGYDRDVGHSAKRELSTLSLNTNFQLTSKTALNGELIMPSRIFANGTSSGGVAGTMFLNHDYSKKTSVGLGAGFGMLKVDTADTQTFEQILVSANYKPTAKLRLEVTTGFESRDLGDQRKNTPLLSMVLNWRWRPRTNIAFSAQRKTINSATEAGTNYVSTTGSLSLSQQLGRSVTCVCSIGYENALYETNQQTNGVQREDHNIFAQFALNYKVNKRTDTSLTLTSGNNLSNTNSSHFFQIALQTSHAY